VPENGYQRVLPIVSKIVEEQRVAQGEKRKLKRNKTTDELLNYRRKWGGGKKKGDDGPSHRTTGPKH